MRWLLSNILKLIKLTLSAKLSSNQLICLELFNQQQLVALFQKTYGKK